MTGPGEMVHLPAGKANATYYHTREIRTLLVGQAAGEEQVGLDSYFREMAVGSAVSLELPANAVTYSEADLTRFIGIAAAHGITLLTPEETRERLPSFREFGANQEERAVQA